MIVKVDSSTTTIKDVYGGSFDVEGTGYLECRLTFISKGNYKINIKTCEGETINITGKGISRITLNTDKFRITVLETSEKLSITINNIKDYFFDILSLN
jgi:hypothetical protein